MERLGAGQLLGPDPHTIFFERSGGINCGTANRNVGDERNSAPAESSIFALLGSMPSPFGSALDQFRCSLQVWTGSGFGVSLSDPAIPPLGSGTIRLPGNKYCSLDRRFRGHLGRFPRAWPVLRWNTRTKRALDPNLSDRISDPADVSRGSDRGACNCRGRIARGASAHESRGQHGKPRSMALEHSG